MLFESFTVTITLNQNLLEFGIQQCYSSSHEQSFEVIQGGINIILLHFNQGQWQAAIVPGLHPVVQHDTEALISNKLVKALGPAITQHYHCKKQFTLF